MITFDNTKIAFANKSNSDLKWSYRLFSMLGMPWLVKFGKVATNVAFALRLPIKGLIKKTIFKQFCGGENIADCRGKIEELGKFNIGTILDYSVEGMTSDEDLDQTKNQIIDTIHEGEKSENIPFAVFKLTGLARTDLLRKANKVGVPLTEDEKLQLAQVMERVDEICKAAHTANVPVFIDAEDSWFQDVIDRIANAMMAKYNKEKAIVYNTLQMYRHDRLAFLKQTFKEAEAGDYHAGVKMVRGAYMEKERATAEKEGYPSPIQPDKAATDRDYNEGIRFIIDHIDRFALCAGTHNEASCALLVDLLEKNQIAHNDERIYFAQLLGMSDHISFNLAYEGYNVAKYVPYGPVKDVMPYLIRRAEENTSVAGQMGRELSLIINETKRRRELRQLK